MSAAGWMLSDFECDGFQGWAAALSWGTTPQIRPVREFSNIHFNTWNYVGTFPT